MSALERLAREQWLGRADYIRFGHCGGCGRVRTADDRPLLVARPAYKRRFLCLHCFDPSLSIEVPAEGSGAGVADPGVTGSALIDGDPVRPPRTIPELEYVLQEHGFVDGERLQLVEA
jgi:hypothetical protein